MTQLEAVVTFLLTTLVFGLACWRVTYFLIADTLPQEPRKALIRRLTERGDPDRPDWPLFYESTKGWKLKATDLLTCPYCMSVWVALAATLITWPTVLAHPAGGWLVWFLAAWMLHATVALIVWAVVEGHDK